MEVLLMNVSCSLRQEVTFTDNAGNHHGSRRLTVVKTGISKDARLGQARRAWAR